MTERDQIKLARAQGVDAFGQKTPRNPYDPKDQAALWNAWEEGFVIGGETWDSNDWEASRG